MRILWFHWMDITHPNSGGAELVAHEISKRLVRRGYEVTHFCSSYSLCKQQEVIDGINVIRDGGKYSVYSRAKKYYKKNRNEFDLIIDEINTRPFFAPEFVDVPVVALIHQLAREFWFYETKFPLNFIGYYFLENYWLGKYKNIPVITVSKSTETDLKKLNFNTVRIIPEGLSCEPLDKVPLKEIHPTIIYVGRLKKAKLPDDAIKAFKIIKKQMKNAQLWIVGDGYMRRSLERIAKETQSIKFWGKLPDKEKLSLMSKAQLILVPAVREGWGLVVVEANAMGTPAVAYNVPGLRDSVQNGINGILTTDNDVISLATEAIKLLNDDTLLSKLQNNSLSYAKKFNWDKSTDVFEKYINDFFLKTNK